MKRLLYLVFIVLSFCITSVASAATLKVIAETQNDFSTANQAEALTLKIVGDYELKNGEVLNDGIILGGEITKIYKAKRGKRDAYAYMLLKTYKLPNATETKNINNPNAIVKISKYAPLDLKDKTLDAGTFVAGVFVKNISYPVNFVRGVIEPQEGENRLHAGVRKTYEGSWFSYISKGKELTVPKGCLLTVTFTYNAD